MEGVRVVLILYVCIGVIGSASAADWSYSGNTGPANWGDTNPTCNLNRQSPVGIYKGDVSYDNSLPVLSLQNYDINLSPSKMSNNGHSVKVGLPDSPPVIMQGGGLTGQYRAAQFHFHWGATNAKGSEHVIDTVQYPMEMHIVHFNMAYGNLTNAVPESDGLAVLGFMFEVSATDNPAFNDMVSSMANIRDKDASTPLNPFILNDLLPTNRDFYTYPGSLTTPGCQESVTWFVLKDSTKISSAQLQAFRTVLDSAGSPIVDNFRPPQPLNTRVVKSSFDTDIHWGYLDNDADKWKLHYEACGAQSQSPISIPTAASTKDATLVNFQFEKYSTTENINMKLKNNGHTAVVTYESGNPKINGGALSETYIAAQFHLHWGSSMHQGSEHKVDNVAYPMELHIVHYRASLGSLGASAKIPDGLAVLGFFFEISSDDNPALEPLIAALVNVIEPYSSYDMPSAFSLDSILPAGRSNYYRYSGSLTTPGCYESVIWTVFHEKIPVSDSQLKALRRLKSTEKVNDVHVQLQDNYRPVQPINGRVIKRSFEIESPHWSYTGSHGVDNWGKYFPTCKNTVASNQSPINIQNTEAEYRQISAIQLQGYSQSQGVSMELSNNGHSIVSTILSGDFRISSGGLSDEYKAAQFHFHWGASSSLGSEHLIDNKAFPLELHIVHYGAGFPSLTAAVSQPNGLAVLGFMFEISETDNPLLAPIVDNLNNVVNPGDKTSLPTMVLRNFLPSSLSDFYRYSGSLTTPGCFESVTWTVFRSTIKISEAQMAKFRSVLSSEKKGNSIEQKPMVNNFRPVQPLNNRVVIANFKLDPDSSVSTRASLVLCAVSVLLALLRLNY